MIPAGDLNQRITFYTSNTNVRGWGGNPSQTFTDTQSRWAKVRPLSSTERLRGSETLNEITYEITMRFTDDLNPADYLEWKGRRLEIKSLVGTKEGGDSVALCSEQEPE